MSRLLTALAAAAIGIFLLAEAAGVSAEGIEVRDQRVANRFPDGVEFSLLFESEAEIDNVRLRYRVLPEGAIVSARPECSTTGLVSCSVLVGETRAELLLPGIEIAYSWLIEDATGRQVQTEEVVYFFRDDRFEWQELTLGNLTAFYYGNDEGRVATLLEAGAASIERMSLLLGTTVDFPVRLWVYDTAFEMQPAIIGSGSNVSITLGEVYYEDTAAVSLDSGQPLDIVRHELTHIVVRAATRGHVGRVPSWLNEGTAVYAQNRPLAGEEQALEVAIRRDDVLPFSALSSASLTSTDTSLFYAQSWSIVSYLIATYGEDSFSGLIAALDGANMDEALAATYGFDLAGLEDEWRGSVGLPPVERQGTAAGQAATATPASMAAGQSDGGERPQATDAASAGDGGGGGVSVTLVIGVLTALLAIAILVLGVYVARKQGSAAP